jgi:CubicO group peptidase (beta-lactamase class C family)
VGLIKNNKTLFYCLGNASPGIKADPDTIYSIGSLTKTFTSTAFIRIALLRNIPLIKPAFELIKPLLNGIFSDPAFNSITFHHLLTHSSGLPRLADNFKPGDPYQPYEDYSEELLFSFFKKGALNSRPGEKYEYSNLGMGILGLLCMYYMPSEESSFESILKWAIFDPLNMHSTFINISKESKTQNPAAHSVTAQGHYKGQPVPSWNFTNCTAGCGAVKSNLKDMLRFIAFQMAAPNELSGPNLKKVPLFLACAKSHKITDIKVAPGIYMGLGWHILKTDNPRKIIWHNGQTYGFRSFAGFDKKTKTGVVILSNESTADIDSLGFAVLTNKEK